MHRRTSKLFEESYQAERASALGPLHQADSAAGSSWCLATIRWSHKWLIGQLQATCTEVNS